MLLSFKGFCQNYEVKIDSGQYFDYTIIEDTILLKKFTERQDFKFTGDANFDDEFLIYNSIWIDCSGSFKITTEYDSVSNTLEFTIFTKYGGSRGMCPQDNFTKIKKRKPGMKILFKPKIRI